MLRQYRECVAGNIETLKAGEDVDFEAACSVEAARIEKYIQKNLSNWKKEHPSGLPEAKQGYFEPRTPYFQHF